MQNLFIKLASPKLFPVIMLEQAAHEYSERKQNILLAPSVSRHELPMHGTEKENIRILHIRNPFHTPALKSECYRFRRES